MIIKLLNIFKSSINLKIHSVHPSMSVRVRVRAFVWKKKTESEKLIRNCPFHTDIAEYSHNNEPSSRQLCFMTLNRTMVAIACRHLLLLLAAV